MKKTHTLAIAFVLMASAPLALAQTAGTEENTGGTTGTAPTATGGAVVSPRDSASGLPTGKRQHAPIILKKELREKASTTRERLKEERGEMKQKIEDRRGEIKDKRDELRGEMKEKRAEIIKKHGERIIHRLEAALERLNKIAARIDSRIVKLGEKGIDIAKAKADLALARTKIDTAKAKLDAAKIAIAGILADTGTAATSTPDGMKGNIVSDKIHLIKEQVRIVETALKEAHKALVLAITDLKGKSDGERKKGTGTTTPAHIDN